MRKKIRVAKGQKIKKGNLVVLDSKGKIYPLYEGRNIFGKPTRGKKELTSTDIKGAIREMSKMRKKFKNPLDLMIFEMMDKAFKKKKSKRGKDENRRRDKRFKKRID